jgi:NAD(P)-dependent dehydrogenase (short-subunit alcohol dehydrogenase family)
VGDVLSRFRLDGRTAIVTGIGPGVGEHVAKAYAEVGANVVCAARTREKVDRVAAEIQDAGAKAIAVATDVGKLADLEALIAKTHDAFGPVHVVFHNAATGTLEKPGQGPWDNSEELWQEAFAVNVLAPQRLTRMLMPDMEQHSKGSIITVLSCAGFTPIPPQIAYGSTKAALLMWTRYLAKICAPHARVNALCPGSMSPDGTVPEVMARLDLAGRNAIKRIGKADEAVGAALFLASDASSYTTGSVVFVEGGRVGTIA